MCECPHLGECIHSCQYVCELGPSRPDTVCGSAEYASSQLQFADEVVAKLQSEGLQDLEELRFFFDSEDHVGRWVAKLGLGDATLLQTARVRSAWSAVRLYFQQAEQDRLKVALADLDSILGDSELRDAKTAFWQRYKLRFSAEVHPSDMVVSRVSRELSKRMLCVFKFGDNLYTEETETDEHVSKYAETGQAL